MDEHQCSKPPDPYRAKETAQTADDFWGNKRAEKETYRRLFKTVADNTPPDLKWLSAMWELAGSSVERVWEQDVDEQTMIRGLSRIVLECLEDFAAAEWIACVPMELTTIDQRFHAPRFTKRAICNAHEKTPLSWRSSGAILVFESTTKGEC